MYWPGTTAAGGAAGFEAALALRVTRQETEAVASPPVTSRPVGQALPGTRMPVVPDARKLPCMADPDLFFAESPADVGDGQGPVPRVRHQDRVLLRRHAAPRAVGSLGRRTLPARRGHPAQATPGAPAEDRSRGLRGRGQAPRPATAAPAHQQNLAGRHRHEQNWLRN